MNTSLRTDQSSGVPGLIVGAGPAGATLAAAAAGLSLTVGFPTR